MKFPTQDTVADMTSLHLGAEESLQSADEVGVRIEVCVTR